MLSNLFKDQFMLGIFQAVATVTLVLLVTLGARWQKIHLEKEVIVALIRGIVQIVLVGLVLVFVFKGPGWISVFILLAMIIAASSMNYQRTKTIPGAFWVSFYGIGLGAGVVILLMVLIGVIDSASISVIPVGSMLVANAMNAGAQALERYNSDVKAHIGLIEAGLALGATPETMVAPYIQSAVHSSLIPRIDNLSSLGIVWIPGLMTGMILAGSDPIYAAIYQFAVIAMIYAASGLTSITSVLLIRARTFSTAQQLILRPIEVTKVK
ncbi:MAG: iron export ABC transporter permease subunit FetB [Chloroflexi bacterium]|uniref:Iron export ABC transporter permease subunit FetB n=1 Tax=Candidatus Chlorohelix allophototropha TaxID=3003348 RepID=A0A8T7M3I3_9CHLR|nr:iron export ABC transporter permease subunit FetB [Chloroflexota bacterium]WJW66046.1 iron export ABC transporter permease subunit FetB [Chloroflexota bacterium L227-S17]